MKKIITLLIFIISASVFTQNEIKKIDSIVNSKIKESDPGLMVGIVKDGEIIYEKYRGLSNLQHQVKANKKTRSNIASTAKQFTALMTLKLSLEEKLKLDDDIRKYLPNLYPNVKEEIKVRHLLNHTSGIRDYLFLLELQQKPHWKQIGMDNDDVIGLLEKQEELMFIPGSAYAYSNSGYNILAKIIEEVTKEKFYTYSKKFFKELGMKETTFIKGYMNVIPNKASPYTFWSNVWREFPTLTKTQGDGFLYTTLKDQLIYEQALQNAKLTNNLLLIKSQKAILNSEIKSYGFGVRLTNRLGREAIHHDGSTTNYNSQTIRFPNENLCVFVMSNNGTLWSGSIADEIASVLLPKEKVKPKDKYDNRLYDKIGSNKNTKIVGQYKYPNRETLIRIEKEGDDFYWKEGNYYNLKLISEDANIYSFANNPKLKVGFYKDEMVEFYPSEKTIIYKRSSVKPASQIDLESYVGTYASTELDMSFELKITNKNQLKIKFSNQKKEKDVKALNRNELLSGSYIIKVVRDQFNRVTNVLITRNNRAKNNRFKKQTNLKFHPKIATENGSIQVTTIRSSNGGSTNILLTKNYPNGNEIWSKQFGGKSYDKASSILETQDGYLIIGSTSSYGKGNYDMFVIKTDKKGTKIWQNTYGGFYNEYGFSAEKTDTGYLIKGTIQNCTSNSDVFNRKCTTNVWFVSIGKNGKELSNKVLEEVRTEYNLSISEESQ